VIVDTSALRAVLLAEREADEFLEAILNADLCAMSAVSFVEASIIAESTGGDGGVRQLDEFIRKAGLSVESVTAEQAFAARQAYSSFGKGRHAASLNLGDCFSYALAKVSGEPLLFKEKDFSKTDITAVNT
jgi:ribonuclease VapC